VKPAIAETAKLTALERMCGSPRSTSSRMPCAPRCGLMDKYELDGLVLPFRTLLPWDIDHMPRNTWQNPECATIWLRPRAATIIVPGGFWPSDGMPFGVQFLGRRSAAEADPARERLRGHDAASPHAHLHATAAEESFAY